MFDIEPSLQARSRSILLSNRLSLVICNVGFALSYWVCPNSYRRYKIQKLVFNGVFLCRTPILEAPKYDANSVVIQGFRHSGNCFLRSNILDEDKDRLSAGWHRAWTVKGAADRRLPVVVLIRQPADVTASVAYRTTRNSIHPHAFFIFPCAALIAWIGYYREIIRLRRFVTVLPLDSVARDYQACRDLIADKTGLRMNDRADWTELNRYTGNRWELKLSPFSKLLLRKADALYASLIDWQHAQARENITP